MMCRQFLCLLLWNISQIFYLTSHASSLNTLSMHQSPWSWPNSSSILDCLLCLSCITTSTPALRVCFCKIGMLVLWSALMSEEKSWLLNYTWVLWPSFEKSVWTKGVAKWKRDKKMTEYLNYIHNQQKGKFHTSYVQLVTISKKHCKDFGLISHSRWCQ